MTALSQITPAQLMPRAATVRNTQVTLSGKTLVEFALGRPRDLMDPAFTNPQLTSTTTQDLLNEEIHKLAMQNHLEIQQRGDRRDLAERVKFFPDHRGVSVFYWQEDPSKFQQGRKSGKIFEGGDYSCQRLHGGVPVRPFFQVNVSKLRPVDIGSGTTSRFV